MALKSPRLITRSKQGAIALRLAGCIDPAEHRTLPLKLLAGKHHSKAYPSVAELHDFGRRVCGVSQPAHIIDRIAQAMQQTLEAARQDARTPPLCAAMRDAWATDLSYAGSPHG